MALRHPLPDEAVDLIAQRFRVLGEPMRIRLLDRLRLGEATVQELTLLAGSTQQNVSKHLGVLLRAGVVSRRRDGNYAYYALSDASVLALCEDVCGSVERQLERLHAAVGGTSYR